MGRDGWIGLGVAAFSGWLYSNLGTIPANPLVPIGPAFYPRLLLLLTIFLSLALVAQELLARRKKKRGEKIILKSYQPTLISFSLFGLYILILPKLGYLLSTVLFVTVLQWFLGARLLRRVPGSLLVGLGTATVTYVIFERYLHVLFPPGSWLP